MKSQKAFWIALICVLIGSTIALGFVFIYPSVVNPTIKMQGMLVSADNLPQNQFSFSVSSKLTQSSQNSEKELELSFVFPNNFPYKVQQLFSTSTPHTEHLPYYVLMGYCYSILDNDSIFVQCAYDKEASLLIINWGDDNNKYLVASTDPSTPPQEIMDYFQDFLNEYCNNG